VSFDKRIKMNLRVLSENKEAFRKVFKTGLKQFIHPVCGFDKTAFIVYLSEEHNINFNNVYFSGQNFDDILGPVFGVDAVVVIKKLEEEKEICKRM
jgi:hypothetical protein